jgi:hypothetical protein
MVPFFWKSLAPPGMQDKRRGLLAVSLGHRLTFEEAIPAFRWSGEARMSSQSLGRTGKHD